MQKSTNCVFIFKSQRMVWPNFDTIEQEGICSLFKELEIAMLIVNAQKGQGTRRRRAEIRTPEAIVKTECYTDNINLKKIIKILYLN